MAACGDSPAESVPQASVAPVLAENPDRNAYFGELHLHTALSFDAYIMGARVGLDDAYRFARGDEINMMGRPIRRDVPLDFISVTDHAEQMGLGVAIGDPESEFSSTEYGQSVRRRLADGGNPFALMTELSSSPARGVRSASISAWQKSVEAANRYNDPGRFTTFIGYEWSSTPGNQNLHRNVIFRGDQAPFPFSSQDSPRPEDLWTYLEANRANGVESLAIPHNANASNGLMYDWLDSNHRPIDEAYAKRRLLNEPLSEIVQNKGQSETHPLLSPNDEFASFEIFDKLFGPEEKPSKLPGSYVRDAYGRGLVLERRTGFNPYKFGMAGGSDLHGGLSSSNEQSYGGSTTVPAARIDREQAKKSLGIMNDPQRTLPLFATGSPGLTGVWAETNTRQSIFDAMRRKETFATSGTRLKVRFFAGWDYDAIQPGKPGWVHQAYAKGTPMGGDMQVAGQGRHGLRFLVWALKDPNGANLDRAQIVKVWLDGETPRERVFDVALSGGRKVNSATGKAPSVGSTVDLETATYTNSIGAVQLTAGWEDPTFDPSQPAVYYLRVVEIPTPRWTTILAVREGLPIPQGTPATLQERAWSSPIWYLPGRMAGAGS
ncbi:hypothetical protein MB02_12580 [Croceicoccus estronivorus]|nr:hypothetical protein MB02_12580 [Croceicoccus estronivorus]